ncbi:MAG: 1-acyl-sn-glycerol-3-phosphate acyltransferase [Deltaproteobacteria bacterium]|nr:1-acyl-sn-glycerol-3-phosphate acyltransferase [Deltaproteobacteria bacterium]
MEIIRGFVNTILFLSLTAIWATVAFVSLPFAPGGHGLLFCSFLWGRTALPLCGVRVELRGAENLPSGSMILMPNHASNIDVPCLMSVIRNIRFVTKHTIKWIPVFGWGLWLAGFVFVNRKNRASAIKSLAVAAKRIRRHGHTTVIFPEGTRSRDGRLGAFKKGGFVLAMEAKVPVVPVRVRGTRGVLPKGSALIRPGRVTIDVGEPVDVAMCETKEELMDRVRAALEGC